CLGCSVSNLWCSCSTDQKPKLRVFVLLHAVISNARRAAVLRGFSETMQHVGLPPPQTRCHGQAKLHRQGRQPLSKDQSRPAGISDEPTELSATSLCRRR